LADLDPALRSRVLEGELLVVAKTNRLAPVHRRARMDYVGLRHVAPDGASAGEARLVPDAGTRLVVIQGEKDPFGTPEELRAALGGTAEVVPAPGTHTFIAPAQHVLPAATTILSSLGTVS